MSKSKNPKLSNNQMSLWIYVVEQMIDGKWQPTWNVEAHLTYNISEQMMQAFMKDNKHPENFRIVMYVSEKSYDE